MKTCLTMEYLELSLDSQLAQTSASREYSKLDWPTFNLGQRIQGIQAVKVVEVAIPKTWYNWSAGENNENYFAFYSLFDTSFYFLTIPEGSYTVESFITTVNTIMAEPDFQAWLVTSVNVTGPITCTLEYTTSTNKFKLVFSGGGAAAPGDLTDIAFSLLYANQPNNFFLGFPTDDIKFIDGTAEEAFYEMPDIARVNWPDYLQVASQTIGDLTKAYNPLGQNPEVDFFGNLGSVGNYGQSNPQFATVTHDVPFGSKIIWKDPDPTRFLSLNGLFQLTSLDLFLTNGPFNKPLKLNGQSFMTKIGLLIDKSGSAK